MKRDWLTLVFGVALVGAIVGLSLRQNLTPVPGSPSPGSEPTALAASAPAAVASTPEPSARRPSLPERPPGRPAPATVSTAAPAASGVAPAASDIVLPAAPVRLNASLPVVHRHGMGSCQGMLAATSKGLSFDTDNKGDAFTVAFADMDEFEVDYLKKNLRIRKRAGRTWNFTNDSADALFVFHRDIAKVRERLAAR